jgi:opacity protein-like surface antigen
MGERSKGVSSLQFRLVSFLYVVLSLSILIQAKADSAFAQAPHPTQSRNTVSNMDFSVGVFGQLTQARIPTTSQQFGDGLFTTQRSQSASPSAGVLGTFHQQFTRWIGYNVNVGYTRLTESYSSGIAFVPSATSSTALTTNFIRGSIGTNVVETTVAAVAQGPRNRRFSTFAQFGGGGLFFVPFTHLDGYNKQIRPTMVFGVGMNYRLTEHLGLRAEYRGLFYKSPDFAPTLNYLPVTRMFTVTNQPAVSLTYTFGGR